MTKQEVNQLLALMKANYSYAFKTMSQQDKYLLLNTWTYTLQDIDANVVMIAVMQLISESKWLPTVAEIREKCLEMHYTALYETDNALFQMVGNGSMTPISPDDAAQLRLARKYIANATQHLHDKKRAGLQLDSILNTPAFRELGSGKSSIAMLGGARYENGSEQEDDR